MLRLVSGAALLLSAYSTTIAAGDDLQINEHTLCRAAIHAFDANDLPMIQENLRFVHNVFDDLDAQYKKDEGERAPSIVLSDKNEGYVVLSYCREAFPEQTEAGVICSQCAHDERHAFASREDLWRDHLFEPLLRWVNDKLAPAVAIALFEYDGSTEAKFVTSAEEPAKATKTVALR